MDIKAIKSRENEIDARMLMIWWLHNRVNIILNSGLIHFKKRIGRKEYIKLLDGWYRLAKSIGDFSIGDHGEIGKTYKRCKFLLTWRK